MGPPRASARSAEATLMVLLMLLLCISGLLAVLGPAQPPREASAHSQVTELPRLHDAPLFSTSESWSDHEGSDEAPCLLHLPFPRTVAPVLS